MRAVAVTKCNGCLLTTGTEYSDFQKRGGFLAEVDNAIFIEKKANKRIVHNKSVKFPARSVLEDVVDTVPMDSYNLAEHLGKLEALKDGVADFII